jgi:hypothetical protein
MFALHLRGTRARCGDPGAPFDTAREGLTELFRTQPLVLGAIGIAIGAGIAAALPKTDIEDNYLGKASETLKTRASEIAGHQVETVTNGASDVIEAASAESTEAEADIGWGESLGGGHHRAVRPPRGCR